MGDNLLKSVLALLIMASAPLWCCCVAGTTAAAAGVSGGAMEQQASGGCQTGQCGSEGRAATADEPFVPAEPSEPCDCPSLEWQQAVADEFTVVPLLPGEMNLFLLLPAATYEQVPGNEVARLAKPCRQAHRGCGGESLRAQFCLLLI